MRKPYFLLFLPIFAFAISDSEFFKIQQGMRQIDAHSVKSNVADFDEKNRSVPTQKSNGDEKLYSDKRGSFNKGLAHQASGFPNIAAFDSLVKALQTGEQSDFNGIEIGTGTMRLVNPQGSLAFSLSGNDAWINSMPPAPSFSSAETAGEMVELYWTVRIRDVNFNDFDSDPLVPPALADLSSLSDFKGPKSGGMVTAGTLLRGNTAGDLAGPYISQFLYLPVPYGNTEIPPDMLDVPTASTTNDFITDLTDWLIVENGGLTGKTITFDTPTFIRTPRDLGEYVHQDIPGQAALSALLILNSFGADALDPNNPYLTNSTQEGFVTFNISQVLNLVRSAVHEGLKAAWFQKWQVNRRLRPEEFGFYVQQQLDGANLGIHPDLIDSPVLPLILGTYSSYFLPIAYPEGSPVHPAYPAGHATLIGAAVTILKAFFNEDFVIPSPMEPNAGNTMLVAYAGPDTLTVGGELNKLASNISLGRDHAGVHYRSDGTEGILLGEKVAIDILNNTSFLFHEDFPGFNLTKFDGTKILVGGKRNTN